MPGMQWGFLLFSVVAWAQFPTQEPQFRVERRLVPGGAELATVFGRVPDSRSGGIASIPMLAVLRDSPGRDRLRTDLLIFANDHWNFNVRGFNPGGNHGSLMGASTHSVLMMA